MWGGVPELLIAGFETLVAGGVSPEVAYLECVGELKLIAELIEERGIAGMREAISNTAELGALLGGPRIVDAGVRAAHGRGARGSPRKAASPASCGRRKRAATNGWRKRVHEARQTLLDRDVPQPQRLGRRVSADPLHLIGRSPVLARSR